MADADLLTTLELIASNLREDLEVARRKALDGEHWQRSWERVIGDLGDLLDRARARPKGRRFVTVLELQVLLARQGEAQ